MDTALSGEPAATEVPGIRQPALREVPWRWRDVLIGVAPMILAVRGARWIDPRSVPTGLRWIWLPFTGLAMTWMLVYTLMVARRHGISPRLPRPRAFVMETLIALLVLVPVMAAMIGGSLLIVHFFGQSAMPAEGPEVIGRYGSRLDSMALLVFTIAVAPVAEELLYRGLLYNALRRRMHAVLAIPLQGFVFGLAHPFGLAGTALIAFVGMSFGAVYEWRKTLLTPIVLHALVNVVGMTLMMGQIAAEANAPVLGVRVSAHERGCLVTEVTAGSAAEEAGLRVGDVISSVGGQPVADLNGLIQVVHTKRVGDSVQVAYIRDSKAYHVEPVLKPRPR